MTPFEAWIFVFVTRASSTVTPFIVPTLIELPSSVFTERPFNFVTCFAVTLPGTTW
jgi:hypothetical protein